MSQFEPVDWIIFSFCFFVIGVICLIMAVTEGGWIITLVGFICMALFVGFQIKAIHINQNH